METVNNTDNANKFETVVDAFVAVKDTHESRQARKKRSNTRYRQTSKGWLRNYYSRLKSRANDVVMYTSEQFVSAAQESNSFLASWQAYVESGFAKTHAPRLISFEMGKEANELPALFYA